MTKVTLAVLEQRLITLKSTAPKGDDEAHEARIKELENQYQVLEQKIRDRTMGGTHKIRSLEKQMKVREEQNRAQAEERRALEKAKAEEKRKSRGRFQNRRYGNQRQNNREEKASSGNTSNNLGRFSFVPQKKAEVKENVTKAMKKNRKKHEARKRLRQTQARILGLEEKFSRSPSQRLANQIEALNQVIRERENRSMNDKLHYLKSKEPHQLTSKESTQLETLQATLKSRDALEEVNTDKREKSKKKKKTKVVTQETCPSKYKVKKLKRRLKLLQAEKETLKEKHFKQPTDETKKNLDVNEAKTKALQKALTPALEERAQFFGHSTASSDKTDNNDKKKRKRRSKLTASELEEIRKTVEQEEEEDDTEEDQVDEVNHYGKNRMSHLRWNLKKLISKRDIVEAKQLKNVTGRREKKLNELEKAIQEATTSIEKTRELRKEYFSNQ